MPIMIAVIFSLVSVCEGRPGEILGKLQHKLAPTWAAALWVWVPVQYANQGIVPLRYRVIVQAVVSYFWDTYLSLASHA